MPTEDSREALALIIPPESKYALLSVSLPVDQELPARLNLGKGISATRGIGFDIPDHWKDWIGSLATDEIRGSALCLWTIAPSERPSILDEENRRLQQQVSLLFLGLLIGAPNLGVNGRLNLLTGARTGDDVDIRQRVTPDQPLRSNGVMWHDVGVRDLQEAARLAKSLNSISGKGTHLRLSTVIRKFRTAMNVLDSAERIHDFVACIEGCILPSQGKTERQFVNRTELFIGPRFHDWAHKVFAVRSAVEHLNDRLEAVALPSEHDAQLAILRMAYECQELARYCLQRILSRPPLLDIFHNDSALAGFWAPGDDSQRADLWGGRFNLETAGEEFNPEFVLADD